MKIKKGYKNTELGWIPEEWELLKLEDATNLITCGVAATPTYVSQKEGIPFLSAQNVQKGKMFLDKFSYVAKEFHLELTKKNKPLIGDILYSRVGAGYGEAAIIDCIFNFSIYVSLTLIKVNNTTHNVFLKELLNSSICKNQAKKGVFAGGGVPNLNVQIVKKFKIPLPPLPEQKKIAKILSTWDKAIENTEKLLEAKTQLKKGLLQKLLTGKIRFKEFENEKWGKFQLNEIFERVTRKNTELNTNVVTISAQRGFVKQEDFFNKIVASDKLDDYFLVNKGEFCYNKSYSNGYNWGATKRLNDFDKAVVTTLYICFKLINENINSGDFFEHYFDANILDEGLTKIAHEGGRAHGLLNVTPHDFLKLKIFIPYLQEQVKISTTLNLVRSELELIKSQLMALKEQKKGLMQKLLTGEVRVVVDGV